MRSAFVDQRGLFSYIAPETKAPRLRKVSRADDSVAMKSVSVTRNRVEVA
jgi:hypothetical protein